MSQGFFIALIVTRSATRSATRSILTNLFNTQLKNLLNTHNYQLAIGTAFKVSIHCTSVSVSSNASASSSASASATNSK
jgi:hypothetical protein